MAKFRHPNAVDGEVRSDAGQVFPVKKGIVECPEHVGRIEKWEPYVPVPPAPSVATVPVPKKNDLPPTPPAPAVEPAKS